MWRGPTFTSGGSSTVRSWSTGRVGTMSGCSVKSEPGRRNSAEAIRSVSHPDGRGERVGVQCWILGRYPKSDAGRTLPRVSSPRVLFVAGGVALLVAGLTGCGSSPHTARLPSTTTASPAESATTGAIVAGTRCASGSLQLGTGQPISEPTGQHSLSLLLTNTAHQACYLNGYPTVALVDSRGAIVPFSYSRSGDQVVTSALPSLVVIGPGGAAYVTINKYRCDLGDHQIAAAARLTPPGDTEPLQTPIGQYPILGYCGNGDPGSTVHVSPVEPTVGATRSP